MYSRDHTLTLTGPTSVADTSKAHMATQPLTFGPTQQKFNLKIKILAIVFLQEKGRVRTSLLHSVGGRNNDPFSFMTENYVKQGFVLARNIPKVLFLCVI